MIPEVDMAKIFIEPAKARATINEQRALESTLNALSRDVSGVRSGLRYKIAGKEAIDARLREAAGQISREMERTRAMRTGLEQIIARYEQAEKSNYERVGAEKTSVQDGGNGGGGIVIEGWMPDSALEPVGPIISLIPSLPWITQILVDVYEQLRRLFKPTPWYLNLLKPFNTTFLTGGLTGSIAGGFGYVEGEVEGKVGTYKNTLTKIDRDSTSGSKFYWDPETKKVTRVSEDDKKGNEAFSDHNKGLPVDFKLASFGASRGISAAALDTELKSDYAGVSTKTRLGELKGEIGGYVGLLGVGGTIGASYTAFSTEAQGYLGSEDYQVYGKVGASAGKVSAEGSFDVGLVDKDGNFNPALQAGGSIEAIGGEISGTVGGKIAGADVSVTGKLNYGVGAHANVGYKDGKLSVDIGASLGVGGSVKLDIDVGGAIDTFKDTAKNIWSGVKKLKWW